MQQKLGRKKEASKENKRKGELKKQMKIFDLHPGTEKGRSKKSVI